MDGTAALGAAPGHEDLAPPASVADDVAALRADAGQPDPATLIGLLERHTLVAWEAAEQVRAARARLDDARRAVPPVPDAERDRLLAIDADSARAAARQVGEALEGARAAQAARLARPTADDRDRDEAQRLSRMLDLARLELGARWRRIALRLVQAAGISIVVAGAAVSQHAGVAASVAAASAPVAVALAWSRRVDRRDRSRLADAEMSADLLVMRLFGEDVAHEAGPCADPAALLEERERAWQAWVAAATAADAALAAAQRRWEQIAGAGDVDRLDDDLASAETLRATLGAVDAAAGSVRAAERDHVAARRAWAAAATAAGLGRRTVEEAESALAELEERRARRQRARQRLTDLEAGRLAAARRRIDVLSGQLND